MEACSHTDRLLSECARQYGAVACNLVDVADDVQRAYADGDWPAPLCPADAIVRGSVDTVLAAVRRARVLEGELIELRTLATGTVGQHERERLTWCDRLEAIGTRAEAVADVRAAVDRLHNANERAIGGLWPRICAAENQLAREHEIMRNNVSAVGLQSMLSSRCGICMKHQVDRFVDPCGHTLCSTCALQLNGTCFVCRGRAVSVRPLFGV
jgi:hypothetical protein